MIGDANAISNCMQRKSFLEGNKVHLEKKIATMQAEIVELKYMLNGGQLVVTEQNKQIIQLKAAISELRK